MKKALLTLLAVALMLPAVAQKANVSKARNKTLSEEPDFNAAREAIIPALSNDETKDDPKTWVVAAQIGEYEATTLQSQLFGGDAATLVPMMGKAQYESTGYYTKAAELAAIPNAKGKIDNGTIKKAQTQLAQYYADQYIIQYGNQLFENKQYMESYDAFMRWATIPDLKFMQEPKVAAKVAKDTLYYQIKYYGAMCLLRAEKTHEALELCQSIKDGLYDPSNIQQIVTDCYRQLGDTTNFLASLEEGMRKYPNDQWFILTMINHYVFGGKSEEALKLMDKIIKEDPSNAQYHFVRGNLLNNINRFDEAMQSYQKALDLNIAPETLPEVYSGMGRSYFNHAVQISDASTFEKDINKLNEMDSQIKELRKKALPYFEKVHELTPDDRQTMITLRQLYYQLNMSDKYSAISAELGM